MSRIVIVILIYHRRNKPTTVWKKFQGERKIGRVFQMGTWHQDRLAVGRKLTSTSTSSQSKAKGATSVGRCFDRGDFGRVARLYTCLTTHVESQFPCSFNLTEDKLMLLWLWLIYHRKSPNQRLQGPHFHLVITSNAMNFINHAPTSISYQLRNILPLCPVFPYQQAKSFCIRDGWTNRCCICTL
jgi:hypothetical protein